MWIYVLHLSFCNVVNICNYFVQKGRVYLLDYEVLDQLPANIVNGKQTYLSAPLCLLHYNQHGELKPIAIQVSMVLVSTKISFD